VDVNCIYRFTRVVDASSPSTAGFGECSGARGIGGATGAAQGRLGRRARWITSASCGATHCISKEHAADYGNIQPSQHTARSSVPAAARRSGDRRPAASARRRQRRSYIVPKNPQHTHVGVDALRAAAVGVWRDRPARRRQRRSYIVLKDPGRTPKVSDSSQKSPDCCIRSGLTSSPKSCSLFAL